MAERQLTIAIPTYNNKEILASCLCSLFLFAPGDYKVIVIDNGEQALTLDIPEALQDRVQVVRPGRNLGWCGGINLALSMCDTPFFCMLNDDVLFLEGLSGFWPNLLAPFEHPLVGAIGPCSNCVSRSQNIVYRPAQNTYLVSLLIGFCMVVRAQMLKDMGGLDETLLGGDDLDLSIRFLQKGMKLVVVREAFLYHFGEHTGRRVYGDNYNSSWYSECIQNELVKKHGMLAWFDTFNSLVYPITDLLEVV